MQAFSPKGSQLLSKVTQPICCSTVRCTESSPEQTNNDNTRDHKRRRKRWWRGVLEGQITLLKEWNESRLVAHILTSRFGSTTIHIPHYLLWQCHQVCKRKRRAAISLFHHHISKLRLAVGEDTSPDLPPSKQGSFLSSFPTSAPCRGIPLTGLKNLPDTTWTSFSLGNFPERK